MPELPEVETTLNGIRPYLLGLKITRVVVRERRLRWPIEIHLEQHVRNRVVRAMQRRGKYLVIHLDRGGLLIHLGMSGSFSVLLTATAAETHDHYDLVNSRGQILRYHDPRRFGCLLWTDGDPMHHPRIRSLGVEPLEPLLHGGYLYQAASGRTTAVKNLLMNGQVVVGVGNIYAVEALFDAGIHPLRGCNRISRDRYQQLADSVRKILQAAIRKGGTTLQDFAGVNGQPGYFAQELMVYGREGQYCNRCGRTIRNITIAQRSTFYCPGCQH